MTNTTPEGVRLSSEDMLNSLSGHEELDIEKVWGADIFELADRGGSAYVRAFIYIQHRRGGLDIEAAKNKALDVPLGDVLTWFNDEPEPTPHDPITEAGKDAESSASGLPN